MLHWSDEIQDLLRKATDEIILDADKALDSFVGCLKAASEYMLKKCSDGIRSKFKKAEWFDEECKENKNNVKRMLKQYKKKYQRRVDSLIQMLTRCTGTSLRRRRISNAKEKQHH